MTEIQQLVTRNHDVLSAIKINFHGYLSMYAISSSDEETLQSLGYMVLDGNGGYFRLTDFGRDLVRNLTS